jgi:hypothetical protein
VRLVKTSYSAGPWRFINDEGLQVPLGGRWQHLHGEHVPPVWVESIGWTTKQAAVDALCEWAYARLVNDPAEVAS